MDDIDPDKREAALLARLEAEREQRLAAKVEAGEIVSVPLFIVAGSATEAARQAEEAKAEKLAELRAAGDQREVVFSVTLAVTGVLRPGEGADAGRVPAAPSFLPATSSPPVTVKSRPVPAAPNEEEAVREAPQPPLLETYIAVQTRRCRDDDDPGEIAEGWYSVDGKVVTVTDARGKYVGSRAMIGGEDPKALARLLLREKQPESFNGPISYPKLGWS